MMCSNKEKLLIAVLAVGLLSLSFLNRLYRAASRNDLPMFSVEAVKAGWPYWFGLLVGVIGCIGYWIYSARHK